MIRSFFYFYIQYPLNNYLSPIYHTILNGSSNKVTIRYRKFIVCTKPTKYYRESETSNVNNGSNSTCYSSAPNGSFYNPDNYKREWVHHIILYSTITSCSLPKVSRSSESNFLTMSLRP